MKSIYTYIIRLGIYICKQALNIIYFFIKMCPIKEKVVMLSRQSNKPSIDFEFIKNEILKRDNKIEVEILCKIIQKDFKERLSYCFYILKCMYHIATSKVCIVDGYSIPVSILKHKKNLQIIQIWHASGAIKKFGYQSINKKDGRSTEIAQIMKMHKNYNYVIAPSKATAKFYEEAFRVQEEKIIIKGLPRLDYILSDELGSNKIKEFYKKYPKFKNNKKKTILYVPTFRNNSSSTNQLEKLISKINFAKYNLIIKLHPLDKSTNAYKYTVSKKYTTFDLLKVADYIITDYSAVAFEASILNKPVYFYVYDIEEYEKTRGLNIDLFKEMSSCTSKDIKEILKNIEDNNYNYSELENFRDKYMGKDYYNNTQKLVDFIFKFLNKDVSNEKIKDNVNDSSKEKLNI